MEKKYKVYKHTFPNGKVYIGITSYRWHESARWKNGEGYNNQTYMRNAIKKYGWENIIHEILFEDLTKEQAEQKEIELIAFYKSNKKQFGYNIQNGGLFRGQLSEQGRKILSDKMIYNNPMKNPIIAEKVAAKTRERHFTEDKRIRMSLESPVKKKIICLNDGNVFDSIQKASKFYNIDCSSISNVCLKKRNTAGKLSFAYFDDKDKTIRTNKCFKKVKCIETNEVFNSIREATTQFGYKSYSTISNILNGRTKTAYGYHWVRI